MPVWATAFGLGRGWVFQDREGVLQGTGNFPETGETTGKNPIEPTPLAQTELAQREALYTNVNDCLNCRMTCSETTFSGLPIIICFMCKPVRHYTREAWAYLVARTVALHGTAESLPKTKYHADVVAGRFKRAVIVFP